MKEIKLTQGFVAFVDDEDFERVSFFKWQILKPGKNIYAKRSIWCKETQKSKYETLHRFILRLDYGDNRVVDHIDGNGLNNTRSNLRICSHADNIRNRINKKPSGCYFDKSRNRWRARIKLNYKNILLGTFIKKEDAVNAHKVASVFYFKEFSPFYKEKL